jgi:hypothetical protein
MPAAAVIAAHCPVSPLRLMGRPPRVQNNGAVSSRSAPNFFKYAIRIACDHGVNVAAATVPVLVRAGAKNGPTASPRTCTKVRLRLSTGESWLSQATAISAASP